MKTLLVTTPNRDMPSTYPPIGPLSLIKYLRKHGFHDVEFYNIDANRPTYDETVEHIQSVNPRVLGISAVVSTAYAYTKKLATDIKRILPETLIIVGGNMAASGEVILRKSGVDICVLGEGEIIFKNIVARAQETTDPTQFIDIPGLVVLDADGKLVNTGYEKPLSAEETYDFDWSDLEKASDIDHFFYSPFDENGNPVDPWLKADPRAYEPHRRGKRVGFLPCVKGCVARCTFCHRFDKGIRHMSVDTVMRHVEQMGRDYNVGFLRLAADTFGADRRWADEFCRRIKEYDVLWQATGIRANSVNPEFIAQMKESGCTSLVYGNETGSERMLKVMEKRLKLEDNYNAMEWTIEANMFTGVQLVIGMPGETPETVRETIEYCKHVTSIAPTQDPNGLSINYAQALPGTPLYEFGRHHGLISQGLDGEEEYLISISDKEAADEHSAINFTDYSKLTCLTWRPLITIEVNYAYVQKYGLRWYLQGVSEGAGGFKAGRNASGYSANPRRLLEVGMEDAAAPNAGEEDPYVPSLSSLLLRGRFGLALLCHPVFFYRVRFLLPLLVLVKDTKAKGLRWGLWLIYDHLASKLFSRKNRITEYKSLRRVVDKDLAPILTDSPAMIPLRKGR